MNQRLYFVMLSSFLFSVSNVYSYYYFWGKLDVGSTVDDNFYKDVSNYNDNIYFANLGLNLKGRIVRGLSYEGYSLLSGRKNSSIYWEDNFLTNFKFGLKKMLSRDLSLKLLTEYENQFYFDTYYKKYNYNLFKIEPEVTLHIFDYTTIQTGYNFENLSYENFEYGYTATGPELQLQQELSIWTILNFNTSLLTKTYPDRYLYKNITSTTTHNRKDEELSTGLIFSTIISKQVNLNSGISFFIVNSNANAPVFNPEVAVTSTTLVENYYSYTEPKLFVESNIYPTQDIGISLSGSYSTRNYKERPATDSNKKLLPEERYDKKFSFKATVSYKLVKELSLKLIYEFENNNSNDYIYNYKNTVISTKVEFFF